MVSVLDTRDLFDYHSQMHGTLDWVTVNMHEATYMPNMDVTLRL
jgi:hypothetical protein